MQTDTKQFYHDERPPHPHFNLLTQLCSVTILSIWGKKVQGILQPPSDNN